MTAASPIGRFAPSPTGNLHFGSLLAAVASYCEVRSQQGYWLLRIDDIDGPRSVAGSSDAILRALESYGFEWDGPVCWQSTRMPFYRDALDTLINQQRVFDCSCSRRTLPPGGIYPGRCRDRLTKNHDGLSDGIAADHALRMLMSGTIELDDAIQGHFSIDLEHEVGDIVIWRRDGLVSYSLACAVDDGTDVTQIVRGADLLESSAAQIGIMQSLSLQPPSYAHVPVAVDAKGDKLSKHSKAQAINELDPLPTLMQAWSFLGQSAFQADSIIDFWTQAPTLWQLSSVPGNKRLPV